MKMGTGPLMKGLMVAFVALVVLAPVQMLRGLIEERARLRQEAVASVARGWGGEQLVGGPILAVPVTLAPGGARAPTAEIDWFVLPESLTLESELKVLDERRKLGVYEVPVYVASVHAGATCAATALCGLLGVYLSGAFNSAVSGSGAGAVFAGVYALLYLLVTSEDYSLLAGSLAVFALLATAMVLTRRLDWYQATARPEED